MESLQVSNKWEQTHKTKNWNHKLEVEMPYNVNVIFTNGVQPSKILEDMLEILQLINI